MNRLAKLVKIQTSAMRFIDLGVSTPKPETLHRLSSVLDGLEKHACPTCHRAFLDEEDDDGRDPEVQAPKTKKTRG